MRVAHVKEAHLQHIGLLGCGPVHGQAHAGQQRRSAAVAIGVQAVEGTGLDQGFNGAFVDGLAIDPGAKIEQAVEGTATFTRAAFAGRDDGLDGTLPGAFDGTQAVTHGLVVDGLEAVRATVDVGCIKAHAKNLGVGQQHLELVGVVGFDGHVGGIKLRRAVDLDPGRVIGQQ